jgi:hypothetical protein
MEDTYCVCPHILRRLLNPKREVVAMADIDGRSSLIVPVTEEAVQVKGAGTQRRGRGTHHHAHREGPSKAPLPRDLAKNSRRAGRMRYLHCNLLSPL